MKTIRDAVMTLDDGGNIVMKEMREILSVDRNIIHTTGGLGKSRKWTPEGFLLCEGVAIARTGEMIYRNGELPGLDYDAQGYLIVSRSPEEVFHPTHIASLEGKSVTWSHPAKDVNPDNVKALEFGACLNVRRGEGVEDDLLMSDILIKERSAIEYAAKYKPELSEGYRCDYRQTEVGKATQHNLIGNHVALVERGRAGPRVSIRDSSPETIEDTEMSAKSIVSRMVNLLVAKGVSTADAEAMARDAAIEILDGREPAAAPAIAAAPAQQRTNDADLISNITKAMETTLDAKIAPILADVAALKTADAKRTKDAEAEEEEEKKRKERAAKDAQSSEEMVGDTIIEAEGVGKVLNLGKTYTGDAAPLQQIKAQVEILNPGQSVPTRDSIAGNKDGKPLAGVMRTALESALKGKHKDAVTPFLGSRTVDSLSGESLLQVFIGSATLAAKNNNGNATSSSGISRMRTGDSGGVRQSVADIQKRNEEYRAKKASVGK
jgi:hypothetical protein